MKVDKYKREYHAATKSVKQAEAQENNAKLDNAMPADQVERLMVQQHSKARLSLSSVRKSPRKSNVLARRRKRRK